jgi:very-short-patch-repair endonuclease
LQLDLGCLLSNSAKPPPGGTPTGHDSTVIIDRPFRGSEAIANGHLTRGRLAGRSFRRIFPDIYAPAGLTSDLRLRSLAAYELVRRNGGSLSGYSAALLLGADCAPVNAPAEVLVQGKPRARPGLVVRNGQARGEELVEIDGCLVTGPVRTAWDLCRRLSQVEAVVALDSLSRAGRFDPKVLLARRAGDVGARGCRRLDDVVALADPRAESPPETRLRLELRNAGLPTPEVQYEVVDEYGFVLARVDLAYPDFKLAIEYDGSTHYTRYQSERDRQRDVVLAGYGWLTIRFGRNALGAAQTAWQVRDALIARGCAC